MTTEIKHFKVRTLPTKPQKNSVYYVLEQIDGKVKAYITDLNGFPIPLIDETAQGILTLVGTGVTGTELHPKVDIETFVSEQLNNQIYLSIEDGKLIVNPITSPDSSLSIVSTDTELQIQLSASIQSQIDSALQSGDNISELINDTGYITTIDLPNTKTEYNTSLTDGDFLFVGDITTYTDEQAQDAVGNILTDTSTIDFTYNDAGNTITAIVKPNSITANELVNNINISEFINDAGYELTSNRGVSNGYASLDSGGKIPATQLPNSVMEYKGLYDASTNTPILVNGVGNTGDVYKVNVAGLGVNSLDFKVNDYAIYNGTTWEKSKGGADDVNSVFGRAGAVVAQSGDYTTALVTETTNKNYQTDNQKLFNDATSSIQTQLNTKAADSTVLHNTGNESFLGIKTGTNDGSGQVQLLFNQNSTVANREIIRIIQNTNLSSSIYTSGTSDTPQIAATGINTVGGLVSAINGTTTGTTGAALQGTSTGVAAALRLISTLGATGDAIRFEKDGVTVFTVKSTGALNLSTETASRIASIDSNKDVKSLNTTTYPDLIELSYVKGVTSPIQTQLNTKVSGAGTAGQVSFWSGASTQTGTNKLFWDIANERFGIGTSTPISPFQLLISNSTAYSGTATTNPTFGNFANIHNLGGTNQESSINLLVSGNNGSNNAIASICAIQTLTAGNGTDLAIKVRTAGGAMIEAMRLISLGTDRLEVSGNVKASGVKLGIRTISATTTVATDDHTLLCDATGAAITLALPAASTMTGSILNIKKINNTANNTTIDPNGAELIDFGSTFTLSTYLQTVMIQSNGTGWFIIN